MRIEIAKKLAYTVVEGYGTLKKSALQEVLCVLLEEIEHLEYRTKSSEAPK